MLLRTLPGKQEALLAWGNTWLILIHPPAPEPSTPLRLYHDSGVHRLQKETAPSGSCAGLLFLAAFGGWGLYYLPQAGRPRGTLAAKGLWGTISGLALVVALLQLWFQLVSCASAGSSLPWFSFPFPSFIPYFPSLLPFRSRCWRLSM